MPAWDMHILLGRGNKLLAQPRPNVSLYGAGPGGGASKRRANASSGGAWPGQATWGFTFVTEIAILNDRNLKNIGNIK